MWGLLSGYINYIKAGLAVLAICTAFYGGFHIGNQRYLDYKHNNDETVAKQEIKVQAIQKEHALVTKGIQDEYDAKIVLLRRYYANGMRADGSSTMSGISGTSTIADAQATYNILAGQCSETTLMVTEWQNWYNGIKQVNAQ